MKWLSRLVLVIAIVASVVAALLFAAGFVYDAHSPIFGVKIPAEYRKWELASVLHQAGPDELISRMPRCLPGWSMANRTLTRQITEHICPAAKPT